MTTLNNIYFNFQQSFFNLDPEEVIRATLYEFIKYFIKHLPISSGSEIFRYSYLQ